jgi:hypothetical protein
VSAAKLEPTMPTETRRARKSGRRGEFIRPV